MFSLAPILWFNFLSLMSMMAILPVIGPIVRELGLSEWHAGIIVSISGIFWMLFARFWGGRSDRAGRRPILLITSIGFMVSYFALSIFIDMATEKTWSLLVVVGMFVLTRAVMGLFFAGIPPVCAAYVADVTPRENRTAGMALLGASTGLAMIVGPSMAGILAKQNLVLPLYIAASVPILCILTVLFFMPKIGHRASTKHNPVKLTDKRLRLPVLAALFASSCIYTSQICIGFYILDILHLSPKMAAQTSGYAMGVVGISLIFIQISISKLPRIAPLTWLKLGAVVAAIGFATVVLINTEAGLLVGYAIEALGLGAIFPSMQSIASQSVGEYEQGVAAGSIATAQGLAMVLAPMVSTVAYELNPLLPYSLNVVSLLVLWLYALKYSRTHKKS